jgi:hypothetical protein
MEQARIKANTERAKSALHKIHSKDGRSTQEKITYKLFIKEKWVNNEKSELDIIVKNKLMQRSLQAQDFLNEINYDFKKYGVPRNEYQVEIK